MSTAAPMNPDDIEIKYKQNDGKSFTCYDSTGWSTEATTKKFAKAICDRRAATLGKKSYNP